MSPIDIRVDRKAPTTPGSERVGPGLSPVRKQSDPAEGRRSVMDTLLGNHDLAAFDAGGNDPYNATGRHFRR